MLLSGLPAPRTPTKIFSELFIALIAGPQDKKNTLDQYYSSFDASMSEWIDWVSKFERTRDFIYALLPADELRGWRGKSDFYTLFLALAPLADRVPRLTNTEKEAIRSALRECRTDVDQAKRRDNKIRFSDDIHEYAEAVSRVATNLGRRNVRLRIVEHRLQNALASVPKSSQRVSRSTAAAH